MKKLITLILLSSSILFFGCKKDNNKPQVIDTAPKKIAVLFTSNHFQSSIYYTINDRSTSVNGVNASFETVSDNIYVKIGDTLTAHMFTGKTAPTKYSIKMSYGTKELAFSDEVIVDGGNNHRINLTHTFTKEDFN